MRVPVSFAILLAGCATETQRGVVELRPTLEDRKEDGSLYSASTQSFLREHHWLDTVKRIEVSSSPDHLGRFEFAGGEGGEAFRVSNLDLTQLVPRLHYAPASPPDAFDSMNLLLAEFSRNGLSVPVGQPGDAIAHFETTVDGEVPWSLRGDYDFVPNTDFRPVRVSIVNNCLASGLWEVSAADRAGEIHHSWFDFPVDYYYEVAAEVNGVPADFVRDATQWRSDNVKPDLPRLRELVGDLGTMKATLAPDGPIGYSSQGSRRKLGRGFAMIGTAEEPTAPPSSRYDLLENDVWLVDFIPPGKYSSTKRKPFDLRFLGNPTHATITRVRPKTQYDMAHPKEHGDDYVEIHLDLGENSLVIGNLPLALQVPQEDFTLHGFGVGILAASGVAERRNLLLERGPAPSFAYLLKGKGDNAVTVNSHEFGMEQIFIRTHLDTDVPYWEISVTSFERIIDLVKYHVEIPKELHARLREAAKGYTTPLYLSYRDDNLR